jgi:tetratricopeptide (TPR) repeat protein
MGIVFMIQRKNGEAVNQFEKALALEPNFLDPLYRIVAIYAGQQETKRAISRVEAQIKAAPQNPFFYNLLGRLSEMSKDPVKAEANYRKAIEINPNIPELYVSLAGFYVRAKTIDKAIGGYNAAIQKDPNSLSAHMGLGMIYDSQKNYEKAKEYYQKALKINPKFPPAANNLAYLYAEQGENIDQALNLAQDAKAQVPEDPHISDTLGWIYYKKNIFGRAVSYLKEASEKIPDNAMIRYHLGMAYFKNDNVAMAKKELAKALELDPRFPAAGEARATLKNLS